MIGVALFRGVIIAVVVIVFATTEVGLFAALTTEVVVRAVVVTGIVVGTLAVLEGVDILFGLVQQGVNIVRASGFITGIVVVSCVVVATHAIAPFCSPTFSIFRRVNWHYRLFIFWFVKKWRRFWGRSWGAALLKSFGGTDRLCIFRPPVPVQALFLLVTVEPLGLIHIGGTQFRRRLDPVVEEVGIVFGF
jgi:hypothetical protein